MQYYIKIISFNDMIEEEVIFELNEIQLRGFMSQGNTIDAVVGQNYLVNIELLILDDIYLTELSNPQKQIECIESSFAHYIRGEFIAETHLIDAGLIVEVDSEWLDGYWYLDGKYVEIKIDRILVEFL